MATFTNRVLILPVDAQSRTPATTDTVELSLFTVLDTLTGSAIAIDFTGSAIDFTGATITGLAGGSTITDGTGNLGFLGAAGALSATGLTSINLSGGNGSAVAFASTGLGTFSARSATGTATYGDGTGTQVFGGSGAITYSGITTYDLDCSGALQINSSAGAISLGNDAVNQAVNLATGGTRTVTIGSANATINTNSTGGASTHTINGANSAAWKLNDGVTDILTVNTDTGSNSNVLLVNASLIQGAGTNAAPMVGGFLGVAAETLAVGDVVCVQDDAGTTKVYKADATTATNKYLAVGVCALAATAGNPTAVASGYLAPATFAAAPAAASNGVAYVYLSETAGQATLTAPTASGSSVVRLGVLYGANGADTTVRIIWQPGFVGNNP